MAINILVFSEKESNGYRKNYWNITLRKVKIGFAVSYCGVPRYGLSWRQDLSRVNIEDLRINRSNVINVPVSRLLVGDVIPADCLATAVIRFEE